MQSINTKLKQVNMKKIILSAFMCVATLCASAQNATINSKFGDNWFIGIGGGVYEPTVGQSVFADMRPEVNFELGRYFTPAFGMRANLIAGINTNNAIGNRKTNLAWYGLQKTAIDFTNVSLDALLNLNNFFGGYNGQPRPFEVVAAAGIGWGHDYSIVDNYVTSKFELDFNFNVSEAVQIAIKPAITYNFQDNKQDLSVNSSYLSLSAGLVYKFGNSNGTHNFKLCDKKYTQSEMDELNGRINSLRNDYENRLANANKTIKDLQDALAAEKAKDKTVIVNKTTTQLAPVVIFDKGKSVINSTQQPSVKMIATYMKNHPTSKVNIKGYASPEGNLELNQKLSIARAEAVYNMLTKTYKIDPARLTKEGLGPTSEVFDENDWNRVCIFIEESK